MCWETWVFILDVLLMSCVTSDKSWISHDFIRGRMPLIWWKVFRWTEPLCAELYGHGHPPLIPFLLSMGWVLRAEFLPWLIPENWQVTDLRFSALGQLSSSFLYLRYWTIAIFYVGCIMKEFGRLLRALCVITSAKDSLTCGAGVAGLAYPILRIAFNKEASFFRIP